MRDEELALVGGVLILLAMSSSSVAPALWGSGWHWPVPDLLVPGKRYPAEVSSGFRSASRPTHHGVDIMYRRHSLADMAGPLEYPTGRVDAGGAKQHARYFAPLGTPILAAKAGRVWATGEGAKGQWVILDHGAPWATAYFHLAGVDVPSSAAGVSRADGSVTEVRAGQRIGIMGHDPEDVFGLLRHLHFEAWYKGGGSQSARNPLENTAWERSTWTV